LLRGPARRTATVLYPIRHFPAFSGIVRRFVYRNLSFPVTATFPFRQNESGLEKIPGDFLNFTEQPA
jgi:hypothetical protein